MRIGSLCSGAGGLDLAVEAVFGAETVWHCELDNAASTVLAHRWPGVPNHRDLITADWATVDPVDIITAGYPCQPFSAAGRRKGTDDERHLWPHVWEAIRRLRPAVTILENVAGHRSLGFDRVLGDLAESGHDVRWVSIRASDVGSCHRRERVWLMVTDPARDGWSRLHDSASSATACTGRQRLTTGSAGDGAEAVDLLPTPNAQDGNGGGRFNSEGHQSTLPGTVRELLPTPRKSDGDGGANPLSRAERMDDVETRVLRLLPTPKASDGEFATPRTSGRPVEKSTHLQTIAALEMEWGKYEPAIRRWESITRPAPAPTELNTKGNPRLNPAFSEWMMGWPAGWVTDVPGISRNDKLRIIGNGVCPQQCIAALQLLAAVNLDERLGA